jgi:hypothetical protein
MSKLANATIVIGAVLVLLSGVLFFNQSILVKSLTLAVLAMGSVTGIITLGFLTKKLLKKVNQNLHETAQRTVNQK